MPALHAPKLTDGVIRIRAIRPDDADAVIAALQDPEIPRWTRVPSPYGPEQFDSWYFHQEHARKTGEGVAVLVTDADDRVLGAVGVQALDTDEADIGYWVAKPARGRGVATRAIRLLRDWLVTELGRDRLQILVDPANTASRRAAEAAGFHLTGEYRRNPRDLVGEFMVLAWPEDGGSGAGGG